MSSINLAMGVVDDIHRLLKENRELKEKLDRAVECIEPIVEIHAFWHTRHCHVKSELRDKIYEARKTLEDIRKSKK